MKAMLLAAGLGKRLKPLTDSLPKPLVLVNGVPLILYNLAILKKHGITDIVVNLHYLAEKIEALLGNGSRIGMTIRYSYEPQILGTGGGIRKALDFFPDEEDILVWNSDIIADFPLMDFLRQHRRSDPLATLVLRDASDAADYGLLHYQNRKLLSILGVPPPPPDASSAHFTGIHLLKKRPLERLDADREWCIVQGYYVPELQSGSQMEVFLLKGYWSDCGTLEALQAATDKLDAGLVSLSYQKELDITNQSLLHDTGQGMRPPRAKN